MREVKLSCCGRSAGSRCGSTDRHLASKKVNENEASPLRKSARLPCRRSQSRIGASTYDAWIGSAQERVLP